MTATIISSDKSRRHVEGKLKLEITPDRWAAFCRREAADIGQHLARRRLFLEDDLPLLVERFRELIAAKK